MSNKQPLISIVICTRNRSGLLNEAVHSLLCQQFKEDEYEILVVDDHSTDDTQKTCARLSSAHPQIRYERSKGRGLLHARVTGQTNSRARYIGYLDDDARACSEWLSRAAQIARERSPVCFGGPFYPFYISNKPRWYLDDYGSFTHGNQPRELAKDEFLCGGNIFFKADALRASGGFDENFCRTGERWTYGDETLPQMRLRRHYPQETIFYDPLLFIRHLVRPERLNIIRAGRECFAMGRSYVKLTGIDHNNSRLFPYAWRFVRSYCQFWFRSAISVWLRSRNAYPYPQNYIYENAFKDLRAAGVFYQSLRAVQQHKREARSHH